MNKFVILGIMIVFINLIFVAIPYISPRTQPEVYLPYQYWFTAIALFYVILPQSRDKFLFS